MSEPMVFCPISLILIFKIQIQKINTTFKNSTQIPKLVMENRFNWDDQKIHLNIV